MQPVVEQADHFHSCFESKLSCSGSPAEERRASLKGPVRRLSSSQRPESHPVSPASSGGGGDASPLPRCKATPGSSLPTSPATVHFTIPAYHINGDAAHHCGAAAVAAAAAPTTAEAAMPASLPAAAAERITLNLYFQEDGRASVELGGLPECLRSPQERLGEAQQQDAAQPAAGTADAATNEAEPQLVQVVFNIVDLPWPEKQGPIATAASPGAAELAGACQAPEASPAEQASLQQQLHRVEACREELARRAGQLRGRVAKLEGAVLAGESRIKAQAAELDALKAGSKELQQQLAAAQAQLGVTPDRSRVERQRLAERAAKAQAAADTHAGRAQQLAAVLAFQTRERRGVDDFAALEYQLLSQQERSLESELAKWRGDAAAATAQLAEARQRLVDTDAALLLRDEEVRRLRSEVEAAQAATADAQQLTAEWVHKAEQFDADRQASAASSRKVDRELELVLQDNERMFRQLNFVRTRLMGQLGSLDPAVPDIGKLARELQSWCDREAAQRGRGRA